MLSDWNGSKRGHVYKFMRSQGFDADADKWVSHRNHRGNICAVDFIWLLNPDKYKKLLKSSWSEAVFGMFKYLVRRASLTESDAFTFLRVCKAPSWTEWLYNKVMSNLLSFYGMCGFAKGVSLN